jgi:hypothetical protein
MTQIATPTHEDYMKLSIISTTDDKFLEHVVFTENGSARPILQLEDYRFQADAIVTIEPGIIELRNSNYTVRAAILEQ